MNVIFVCALCMNVQAYTVMAENIILDFNYSKRKKDNKINS